MKNVQVALVTGMVLVTGIYGCGNRESQLVGKWKGSAISATGSSSSNDMGAAFANAMAGSMTVEFKSDKQFSMNMMIVPVEGTWSLSGSTVTLTPSKVMGMDMNQLKQAAAAQGKSAASAQGADQPMNMTLSADGKQLTMQGKNGQQGQMTFTKDTGS